MNIRYLRTFVTAAETSSFSLTGERLGLTQSAVSMQIRRLEEDFGCALFVRTGKSVRLSSEGNARLDHARRMGELYQELKGERPRDQVSRRTLELGAISTVQLSLMPSALSAFRAENTDVQLSILPGISADLLDRVDTGQIDLAAIVKPRLGLPTELKWVPLIRERNYAIAPTGSPDKLRELLKALPFIRYNRRSSGGLLVDLFLRRHRLWVRESVELDEPSAILQMVARGMGCSIIPGDLLPVLRTPGVKTVPLPGRPLTREIGVVTRQSAWKNGLVRALIASLQTAANEHKAE